MREFADRIARIGKERIVHFEKDRAVALNYQRIIEVHGHFWSLFRTGLMNKRIF
jgi:hypothetical protein